MHHARMSCIATLKLSDIVLVTQNGPETVISRADRRPALLHHCCLLVMVAVGLAREICKRYGLSANVHNTVLQ